MKTKKFLAVGLALTMVISSSMVVFASEETATGSGVVENDNSADPEYYSVVLPTTSANTFNFAFDPDKMLSTYDPDNYEAAGTFYFKSTKTEATIKGATGKVLYEISKEEESDLTGLKAAITGTCAATTDAAVTVSAVETGFYVWTPDTTSADTIKAGTGQYVALTKDNIKNYFDLKGTGVTDTFNISQKSTYLSGTDVFDGEVYKDTYTKVFDASNALDVSLDAKKYGTITDAGQPTESYAVFTGTDVVLYTSSDGTTFAAAVDADVVYTKSVVNYNNKSDKVKIENKSTFKTDVTATVTVSNVDELNFADSTTLGDDDLYMSITDGASNTEYLVNTDGTATATFTAILNGVDVSKVTVYQTSGTDSKTGSHKYAKFFDPDVTTNSVSFYITGATQKKSSAGTETTGWGAYVDGRTALETAAAPEISVVYGIEKHSDDAAPSVSDSTKSFANGSNTSIAISLGGGTLKATGITKITFTGSSGNVITVDPSKYSIVGSNIVIDHSLTDAWYSANIASRVITITFNDTAQTAKTVTLTKAVE